MSRLSFLCFRILPFSVIPRGLAFQRWVFWYHTAGLFSPPLFWRVRPRAEWFCFCREPFAPPCFRGLHSVCLLRLNGAQCLSVNWSICLCINLFLLSFLNFHLSDLASRIIIFWIILLFELFLPPEVETFPKRLCCYFKMHFDRLLFIPAKTWVVLLPIPFICSKLLILKPFKWYFKIKNH